MTEAAIADTRLCWVAPGAEPGTLCLRWREGGAWREGDLAAFAAHLAGRPCVLLVAGEALTTLVAEIPARDLRTARQALPFAVEDQLAEAVEQCHLALERRDDGRYAVAVMARAFHDTLVTALAAQGIEPVAVTTACAVFEAEAASVVMADCGGRWLLTLDDGTGLAFAADAAGTVLTLLRARPSVPTRLMVLAEALPEGLAAAAQGMDVERRPLPDDTALLEVLARRGGLMLVEPAQGRAASARAAGLWRIAAAAALALALAYPAWLAVDAAALARRQGELAAANGKLLRATFPAITRVVNPRVQADQALAALRARAVSGPTFLALLARVDALAAAALPAGTHVVQATYSDGVLELAVETDDMAAVERVRSALQADGLVAEMLSAESGEARVLARLRLREAS